MWIGKTKFPDVIKRTFKQPAFLKDYDSYEKYDIKWDQDVLTIHNETENRSEDVFISDVFCKLKTKSKWEYSYSYKRVSGSTKFPCIGGPLNGKKAIFNTEKYIPYNCSSRYGRCETRPPKGILIHESFLKF